MYKKRCRVDVVSCISKKAPSKKGQVTLFIILGILLLLALALVIFIRQEVITINPEEIVPTTKGKVENFITRCMDEIGDEALFLLGQQAGFIEIPDEILGDASIHLKQGPEAIVPYWAYGNQFAIQSLEQIKTRLDLYMEANLRECLFEAGAFSEAFDLVEKSDLVSNTEIVESGVIFNVHWDLEVKNKAGEVVSELLNHVTRSDVKLRWVHDLSVKIVEAEMATMKLEELTQDLISLDHPKVPLTGMELSCKRKTWSIPQTQSTIQDMLRVNIGRLQIAGTDVIDFPDSLPYYQNHYLWDVGEENRELQVSFNFDNFYPMTFRVGPSSGGKLVSSTMGGMDPLKLYCVQQWKFNYDIVYPVLVRVTDPSTGYDFLTSFTVHLIRNIPNRESTVVGRPSSVLHYPDYEEFCAEKTVPMTVKTWDLVDNSMEVYDSRPLDGVAVSFSCLKPICDMGESDLLFGFESGLQLNFPYCVGGIMIGEKEGYKTAKTRVTTKPQESVDLYLAPLFEVPMEKVGVVLHEDGGDEEAVKDEDLALLKLKHFKDGEVFHEVEQVLLDGTGNVVVLGQADFEYVVDLQIYRGEDFIGGYLGNWTADWNMLKDAEKLIFHAYVDSDADEVERFALSQSLLEKSVEVDLPELINE